MLLIALAAALIVVWIHGVVRMRWFQRELAQHDPHTVTVAVPGLVSPIAAAARLRAELARAERARGTTHVAIARTGVSFDQLATARAIADALPDHALGILWDAGVVIVTSPIGIDVDALPTHPGTAWTTVDTSRMSDIDGLVAA